jgi:hypothetical protein
MKTVLLLGRLPFDLDNWRPIESKFGLSPLLSGTCLEDVEKSFEESQGGIDHVIMGAGLALEDRLDIIRCVFEKSDATTVHMKDRASGREGFRDFVERILGGLGD